MNVYRTSVASTWLLQKIQTRIKSTQQARKKLPSVGKQSQIWVSKSKITVNEDVVDKAKAERKIVDSVWLMKEYNPQTYSLEDAIQYHKELAAPDMLNNLDGYLNARFILDMTSRKKTKFMENIHGTVYFPNYFKEGIQKEVIAICKNESEIEEARKAGALLVGHQEVIKKLEKGEISDQSFDYIVCTPETYQDVLLIKKKINKDKLPSLKSNTVTLNIGEEVHKLHLSKEYESNKMSDDKAILKIKIGPINFEVDKLVENFSALVEKIRSHKKYNTNNFITSCVLFTPPSTEKFKVDLSRYIKEESKSAKIDEEEKELD